MAFEATYKESALTREEVDHMPGRVLLEFGVDWCPHCQAAQGPLEQALGTDSRIAHIKIEDGPGRRLGRSFRVKLWPTLILLADGQEIGRVVRPTTSSDVRELLLKAAP